MLKIIEEGLNNYEPWSGAVNTWDDINNAHKVDEFEEWLEEAYPDGVSLGDINDLLWFESEFILELLGIEEEEE